MSSASTAIWPVILSGGAGTRLWPLSRSLHPKQLLPIADDRTMLQATAQRVIGGNQFHSPIVVTSEDHRFLVAEQLLEVGVEASTIILEPDTRNTAPAIAAAAHHALQNDPDAILLIMPADHVIDDKASFYTAIEKLLPAVHLGYLGTFGIAPDRPETGFGYIHAGREHPGAPGVRLVDRFVEKPAEEAAKQFLQDGAYLWNGGIFLFRAAAVWDAMMLYAKPVADAIQSAMERAQRDGPFLRPNAEAFLSAPSISIDHAVMEKVDTAAVVPVEMNWSDVGSWEAVWNLGEKDSHNNVLTGNAVVVETENSLLRSEDGQTVIALGMKDIVVVSTRDAILLMPRDRSQDVKRIVELLEKQGSNLHQIHKIVHRPWGYYEQIGHGDRFQTKRLMVKPGKKLSLQMHHHRSEHWVVVAGTAKVTVGEEEVILQENQSTYIPAGTVHRLENPGRIPLHVIEVQCGTYLEEDDIVRFEDDYRRL